MRATWFAKRGTRIAAFFDRMHEHWTFAKWLYWQARRDGK